MTLAEYLARHSPWWQPPAALQARMDEGASKLAAARALIDEHRLTVDEANRALADGLRAIDGLATSEHATLLAWIEDACCTSAIPDADPISEIIARLTAEAEGEREDDE